MDVCRMAGTISSKLITCTLNSARTTEYIKKISNDGFGTSVEISLKPITDSTIYTKGTGASYPERDIQAPIYVVTQTATDNGIGGQAVTNYTYSGLRVHLQGRRSLGFSGMDITDVTGGVKTSIDYRQDYPFVGLASHTEKRLVSNNQLLSESDATYAHISPFTGNLLGPVAPYASQSIERTYDLASGQLLLTTTTTPTYDNYGNPETTAKVVSGGGQTFREDTTNYYTVDTTNWCLSMPNQTDVTITGADSSSVTRASTFGWDSTTCRLTRSTILPGAGDSLEMTTAYTYDSFGNRRTQSVSGPIDTARTTTSDFSSNSTTYPNGQFITTITNALGHSETREYNARFGSV